MGLLRHISINSREKRQGQEKNDNPPALVTVMEILYARKVLIKITLIDLALS